MTDYYFPRSIKTIGESAFAATALKEIRIDYADSIGPWAFAGNTSLTEIQLPGGESDLGDGVLMGCKALKDVSLPVWLYELPDYALASTGAVEVSMPSHVTSIGAYALACNRSATDVTLPPALTYIDDYAMEGLTALRKLHVFRLTSVPALGDDVWRGINKSSVNLIVSPEMADAFAGADQWREFNITPDTSGTETSLQPGKASTVSAYFDGDILVIGADGQSIGLVEVFDPYGRMLASVSTDSDCLRVPTTDYQTDIFIVRRTDHDGVADTFKIAR